MSLKKTIQPGWSMLAEAADGYAAAGAGRFNGLHIVVSWGGGWDHVSVGRRGSPPTWDAMAEVKACLFEDEDCVIEYHPPRSKYVNNHPNVLHLWRPRAGEIPMPPREFV